LLCMIFSLSSGARSPKCLAFQGGMCPGHSKDTENQHCLCLLPHLWLPPSLQSWPQLASSAVLPASSSWGRRLLILGSYTAMFSESLHFCTTKISTAILFIPSSIWAIHSPLLSVYSRHPPHYGGEGLDVYQHSF
jgi:hypothetical protein